jgi:hypothetical protein
MKQFLGYDIGAPSRNIFHKYLFAASHKFRGLLLAIFTAVKILLRTFDSRRK